MNLAAQISTILKKDSIAFKAMPTSSATYNLLRIFSELTPERLVHYDLECIDTIDYYNQIISEYAQATSGEFTPSNINTTGKQEEGILIEFQHDKKIIKLKIEQNGSSWVTQSFLDQFKKFCTRNLHGNFLSLPTGDQTFACVYLPKKTITKIEKNILIAHSTDSLVVHIANGGEIRSIKWDEIPYEIISGYTKTGESIATALIKSNIHNIDYYPGLPLSMAILDGLRNGSPVNLSQQNTFGETALQLARQNPDWNSLIEWFPDHETVETETFNELLTNQTSTRFRPGILTIFNALKNELKNMFFNRLPTLELEFSKIENYYYDEDSVTLEYKYNPKGFHYYTLFIQTKGAHGGTINKIFDINEADQIIDLIKKYCNNELWSTNRQTKQQ